MRNITCIVHEITRAFTYDHKHNPHWFAGTLTLVLIRWFADHPDAWERDSLCRPMCPGLFRNNHCLWKYAKSQRPRNLMTSTENSSTYQKNIHLFGSLPSERAARWNEEKQAYYGLITPSSIISTVNLSREYDSQSMQHTDDWLETVTVVWRLWYE